LAQPALEPPERQRVDVPLERLEPEPVSKVR